MSRRKLYIEQKEREPLDIIANFLVHELTDIRPVKVYGPYERLTPVIHNPTYIHTMQLTPTTTAKVLHKLLPYIHRKARHKIITNTNLQTAEHPLDDDWVVGFWEGDGSIRSSGNIIEFSQEDKELLTDIQTYLGLGHIHEDTPQRNRLNKTALYHRLSISVNKKNVTRIGELLSLVRTPARLEQLNKILT